VNEVKFLYKIAVLDDLELVYFALSFDVLVVEGEDVDKI
jgi:hypothetical protein